MAKKIEIHPDMTVEDLVEKFPSSVGHLMEKGIVCMICGEPVWGTVGELISDKGLDVEKTIEELEKKIGESNDEG
ncbi:DUF1858 domain-containing protein [bacterium]|nr:MAG: DUF1858 domain-containing protein [bacterium]